MEILMILFSSYLAWPESVFLNRGNHEDHVRQATRVLCLILLSFFSP